MAEHLEKIADGPIGFHLVELHEGAVRSVRFVLGPKYLAQNTNRTLLTLTLTLQKK